MTAKNFCTAARADLAGLDAHEPWVRGARGLCDLYAGLEEGRFESVLTQIARGSTTSAVAEGARWLLSRLR